MPRFLIEFRHSSEHEGCIRSLAAIMNYGSHLVTQAEYGCEDGVHSGWMIVESDSHETARNMVPPPYRADTQVVQLRQWTREQIEEMLAELEA